MSEADQDLGSEPESDWEKVQASPEFAELRRRLRVFVFPVSALFLLWYLLYVLLADYATGFMSTKLFGNINVALVFGLLQFVTTFAIAYLYARFARRKLDPLASDLKAKFDEEVNQ